MNTNISLTPLHTLDFSSILIEYVTNWKGDRIGVLMAAPERSDNTCTICIGWSLVRSDSDDLFNKKVALDIATGRIELSSYHKVTIPFEIVESGMLDNFVMRCMKYYRSNKVEVFGRIRLHESLSKTDKPSYEEYTYGHKYIPYITEFWNYGGTSSEE